MIILSDLSAPETDFRPEWRLPHLEKRLTDARCSRVGHYYDWLAKHAAPQLRAPVRWASLLTEHTHGGVYWVTPVHLNVGLSSIAVQSIATWDLPTQATLLARLNDHFAADGFEFAATASGLLLKTMRDYEWITDPADRLVGRDLRAAGIGGTDAPVLKKTLNEIQMLLHAQTSTPQALWIWAYGTALPPPWPRPIRCSSTDPLLLRWLAPAEAEPTALGDEVVVLPTVTDSFAGSDWATHLDERVEACLSSAWRDGASRVSVWLDGTVFEWRPSTRWMYPWRRWQRERAWWERL